MINIPESYVLAKTQFQKILSGGNSAGRIHDHKRDKRQQEDNREDDGDTVKVLLYDAGAGLRRVHGAGDHIGDARALARMQQNEDDETQAGDDQQGDKDDQKRIHVMLYHSK